MNYETRLLLHSLWLATLAAIGQQTRANEYGSAGVAGIAVVVAIIAIDAFERRMWQ